MQKIILFAAAMALSGAALAQDNTGSIDQSTQSEWSSSTTTTTSGFDNENASDRSDASVFQSSPEMKAWIESNNSNNGGFGVGFGHDNDEHEDDRPAWSRHQSSRPGPDQIDGTYKVTASTGEFLCTVRLKASPFFGGYWATTSAGCPELWKVSRWDFQGPSIVLTDSSGDVFASFWPRARDLWVGRATASGQRLSLSR